MQKLRHSISIAAPRVIVWNTLWSDETFRDWASSIDEGSYMVGEMKAGNKIQFISASSGYGVTSLVEKLVPYEYVLLRQIQDTKDRGEQTRDNEWTGGTESYALIEEDGRTVLTTEVDVPPGLEEAFTISLPKALARIKELAER